MRRLPLLLVLFALAAPAFARVLSYAPYTDRVAIPAVQPRAARHFVLAEYKQNDSEAAQVVLYDTAGDEPRVIYPQNGGYVKVYGLALYEVEPPVLGVPPPPGGERPQVIVMAVVHDVEGRKTVVSSDGGQTWREAASLRGVSVAAEAEAADYGGPFVRGLDSPIRLGTREWPFIVSGLSTGIVAVAPDGRTKVIDASATVAIGQSADGGRVIVLQRTLVPIGSGYQYTARVVDVRTGAQTPVGTGWSGRAAYSGWIAPDGTVYVLTTRLGARMLYRFRQGEMAVVGGPRGRAPEDIRQDPVGNWTQPERFFAVPTADFSGAWMIRRDPGQPTDLLRHTIADGTRLMWSDPAGPEVEALIAGNSGQTLLVQVHRDRTAQMQRPFIDPALAVWRVGDPMPREYDELYLNEQLDKGFVHVDVDSMAAGAPFVFYSGTIEPPREGPISPAPIGGGGDVIQEWGVVRGSLRQRLILPGVARAAGAFGSLWRTDVTIYNGEDSPQQVQIRYLPMGAVAAAATNAITITLQPREVRFVADVLQSLFGVVEGGGALHFLPTTAVNVFGRTYSRSGEGTYGFGMIAIDEQNATGPRFALSFAGAFPGEHFRTNVLISDTSGRGAAASLTAYGVTGAIGATDQTIFAPAGGVRQFNGLGTAMGLLHRESGGLVVRPTNGTAIVTVVAMDNRTNDPTYFPPDLPSNGTFRTIPVIGHAAGAHGAQFRSDLYLYNPAGEARTVILEARSWDGLFTSQKQFTLLPREARVIPDALMTLFGRSGVARLRYATTVNDNDGVRVTSRAYTIGENGATYGSLVPPLNNFQAAGPGESLEILGATAGAGFRTNIGLVELSNPQPGASTRVRIRLFDQQHREIDTFTTTVARGGGMQINDVFTSRGVTPPAAALIVVEVLDLGLIGAYGTLTDNVTNDTTYVGANLAAKIN